MGEIFPVSHALPPPPSKLGSGGAGLGGFTLIEMLVVLVVVALVSGILLTAYEHVLDIRIRLAAFLDGTDAPTLVADWFRGSTDGLLPDQKDGNDVFAGSALKFSGLSVAPIDGVQGVPTRIEWELVFDPRSGRTSLRYRSGAKEPLIVGSWPGNRGGFHYCGSDLKCGDSWPPSDRKEAQLPALIVLEAIRGTENWPIAGAPQAAHDPLPKTNPFQSSSL